MSAKKMSSWMSSTEGDNYIENNLYVENSKWINSYEATQVIEENTGYPAGATTYAATPAGGARVYSVSSYSEGYSDYNYDDSWVSGYYNTGGYSAYSNDYNEGSDGDVDIYIEGTGYNAYGEYGNYSNYGNYYDYYDYYNYYNYSKTMVYFYWTKNNDGSTKMTGSETGAMSPWAMAVQANALIQLINTHAGKSIGTVSAGTPMTYAKYNEMASALGVTQLSANTKITVTHFYSLQTAFNNKGYYKNS